MGDHQARVLLAVAGRLAGYPDETFAEDLAACRSLLAEELPLGPLRFALAGFIDELAAMPLQKVQEQYVAVFDLKNRTNLYLTAHELGDSRERGVALLELRALLAADGFAPPADMLPDYMPMLYEWASVAEEGDERLRLLGRLGYATQRVRGQLAETNPYRPLYEALMTSVFEERSDEAMQELERRREKPDLEPMPYPLLYG